MTDSELLSRLPTIPEYFSKYVDPKIDLTMQHSIPCPFHGETHGKSFSYSPNLEKWRCWGACHTGGDVVDLHRLNYKLKTRKEALTSLCNTLGIEVSKEVKFEKEVVQADPKLVYRGRLYALALSLAKTPDDWDMLDYMLSQAPFDTKDLEMFCASRGHLITMEV